MPIVRRTRAEIDKAKLLAELAARPQPSEDEIDAPAIEDGDAWTDEELAGAEPIYPPPSPDQVRALQARPGRWTTLELPLSHCILPARRDRERAGRSDNGGCDV
jgi:hypothetical protein